MDGMNIRELFRKTKTSTAVAELVPPGPEAAPPAKPQPSMINECETMEKEYLEVAKAIGLQDSPAIFAGQLKEFLIQEVIPRYNGTAVADYMAELCRRASVKTGREITWEWKPLRPQDAVPFSSDTWTAHFGTYDVPIRTEQYTGAVPLPVLLTVKKLIDRFGDRVCFFVSDYRDPKPDPFLMITGVKIPCFIIERWDEPGFRSK